MPAAQDQLLLEQVADGDQAALATLYERYRTTVFSTALRITGNHGSAEEVTQDTFLRLWQHVGRYQAERGSLQAWLTTITQRRAIDELRYRRGARLRLEVGLMESVADASAGEFALLAQLRADLQHALAGLPKPQRELIELLFFYGLERQEIARQRRIPLGTIHSRLRLALEKLRHLLREEPEQA
jgi:RNA polymerase sigma-70 factor, ECF subfamily